MRRIALLLAALFVATACPGEQPDPVGDDDDATTDDDDATTDDDDATDPPDGEVIVPPTEPPEGVDVSAVEGFVVLPAGFPWVPGELSVRAAWGGQVGVRDDGSFTTTMNVHGAGALELLDPDGATIWMVAHPRADFLVDDVAELSPATAAASLMFLQPGWALPEPALAASLLAIFASLDSFGTLESALADAWAADPHAWTTPPAAVAEALAALSAEAVALGGDDATALSAAVDEALGEGRSEGRDFDDDETDTELFHDLDGRKNDLVQMDATVDAEGTPPTMSLQVSNHGARPVWLYLDDLESDYSVFVGDHFQILGIVPARNTAFPSPTALILTIIENSIAVVISLFDSETSTLDFIAEQAEAYVNSLVGPATEAFPGIDLTGYEHSILSVYGLGIPVGAELLHVNMVRRHYLPVLHGALTQVLMPLLSVLTNNLLGGGRFSSLEIWDTVFSVLEPLATSISDVFQLYTETKDLGAAVAALLGALRSGLTGPSWDAFMSLAGFVGDSATVEAMMQTMLGAALATVNIVSAAVAVVNLVLTTVVTFITAVAVDWTDKYVVDLTPTPSDMVVLGRDNSPGGMAAYRLEGPADTDLTRLPLGFDAADVLATGASSRDAAIGGPFGEWAYITQQSGHLALVDLLEGAQLELDQDFDPETTTDGAPEGISRLEIGSSPRGVDLGTLDGLQYGFAAVEDALVVFDPFWMEEIVRHEGAALGLEGSERPYDVAVIDDDKLYVTLWGGFSTPTERTAVLDLAVAVDPSSPPGLVRSYVITGGDTNNQWLEPSPDGAYVAVTNPNTDRIAILDVATDTIFDVGEPGFPSQLYTPTPFNPSPNPQAVAWAPDSSAVYAGYLFGPDGTTLSSLGTVRRCELVLGECRHAVGVAGNVRGLAVFGLPGAERVVVSDSGGGLTVLQQDLFLPGEYSGTDFSGQFNGTGGCLGGGIGTIAEACPESASLGQQGGRVIPYP